MASFDFLALPEDQQLAFYGALLAMARADGHTDARELAVVLQAMDLEGMSGDGQARIRRWLFTPPHLGECLEHLEQGPRALRFGVVLHLTELILADGEYAIHEKLAMREVRDRLGVDRAQALAIEEFVGELFRLREQGLDEGQLERAVKTAAAGLTSVGVPLTALSFSGSLVGLGAKGVLAALASLGLGLGLVPGIGVALAMGAAGWMATSWAIDRSGVRQRQKLAQAELERRGRLRSNGERLAGELRQAIAPGPTPEGLDEPPGRLAAKLEKLEELLGQLWHLEARHLPTTGEPVENEADPPPN